MSGRLRPGMFQWQGALVDETQESAVGGEGAAVEE